MGESANNASHNVGLFITCLADLLRPQVGFAAAYLIEQCGCRVTVPQQSCCGQPAYNNGDDAKARALATNLIAQFEQYDYVVAPSGSCAAMVKQHYPKLLSEQPAWLARAQNLADKTYELSQFLVDVMQLELPLSAHSLAADKKITYHDSCSGLRELGIRAQPRKLLSERAGITIDEMNDTEVCCGFGGTFSVKYPEISTRLVDEKIHAIDKVEADMVLGGDLGCLINIAGRLTRCKKQTQVFHFAEWLLDEQPEAGIAEL